MLNVGRSESVTVAFAASMNSWKFGEQVERIETPFCL